MKITFVITDKKGRSNYFVTDKKAMFSLSEILEKIGKGEITGYHKATRKGVTYVRTNTSDTDIARIQSISVPGNLFFKAPDNFELLRRNVNLRFYWEEYARQVSERIKDGELFFTVDGYPIAAVELIKARILLLRQSIFDAAKQFQIDPYLLAGIIIDELVRIQPLEEIIAKLLTGTVSYDGSFGVAQVKLTTAKKLIRDGVYNPNESDPRLRSGGVLETANAHILEYVLVDRTNLFFAAAVIRRTIDDWKQKAGITIPPVISATLYSLPFREPHPHPKSNPRGEQITGEFYSYAKLWLGEE